MKKSVVSMLVSWLVMAGFAMAAEITENYNFRGEVNFDSSSRWKIQNTRVTSSATDLNQLDSNVILGDLTVSTGTVKVDRVQANLAGFTDVQVAGLPKNNFTFMDDFFAIITSTNVTEATTTLMPWSYTGDGGQATDLTIGATAGGILKLITGATSNNEAYIQYGPLETEGSFGITSNGSKKVWFEARVAGVATSNNAASFIGLSEAGSSAANYIVDTTGVLDTNKSWMGFECGRTATNTYYNFQINKADAASIRTITNVTANLGNGTYKRLGFTFDGVNLLTIYADGTAASTTLTINDATFPTATMMSPIVAQKSIALSYSPTQLVDYIWIQQER